MAKATGLTRPRNMQIMRTTCELRCRLAVPIEVKPTVPKAEPTSTRISRKEIVGEDRISFSTIDMKIVDASTISIDRVKIV
mgnify:CR=1 FL=1